MELRDRFFVRPGKKLSLKHDHKPDWRPKGFSRETAEAMLAEGVEQLAKQQELLYAQDRWALLVVFQAMDAAGKDGTIKHVMSGVNPQGCEVHSFKAPSAEEIDHDYLWRCMRRLPERGRIGIFNRSYYEEVLVVRVHPGILAGQRMPEKLKRGNIWKRRFAQIREFESYLYENGVLPVKFFLNVSKEEQKKRFLERIETPEKNWKFSAADVREREHWRAYQEAYEDALRHTSTEQAPWYVIPADDKPFMRAAVAQILADTMKGLKLRPPEVSEAARKELAAAKRMLLSEK